MPPTAWMRRSIAGLAVAALAATGATAASASPVTAAAEPGLLMNYVVNTKPSPGHVRKVERAVQAAGGTVLQAYPQLGVVVAQSTNSAFRSDVRTGRYGREVQSVGATRTAAVSEGPVGAATGSPAAQKGGQGELETAAAPTPDPREPEQWDLVQIKADQAHKVTEGSRRVLVGINDSGVDDTHPDLAPNFDATNSVGCADNGVPDRSPAAWRPSGSHGTHVAGTVAAARNGVGIVGVAPGVRIASVKVVNADGYIYPEYAICGIVWAAQRGMDVTNHSYFIDPYMYWCDDDGDQGAVQEAVRRAFAYATKRGVLSVAAAGNANYDLANKTTDSSSPNDSTPVTRQITNDCLDLPTELPGVITVASTTQARARSSFSNFGLGKIDVAAPGSGILSTVPGGDWKFSSGTSMASPHVAGVAALLKSTHPWWGPRQLESALRVQADDTACPTAPSDTRCTGTTQDNAFFGEGIVDALDAVKR